MVGWSGSRIVGGWGDGGGFEGPGGRGLAGSFCLWGEGRNNELEDEPNGESGRVVGGSGEGGMAVVSRGLNAPRPRDGDLQGA